MAGFNISYTYLIIDRASANLRKIVELQERAARAADQVARKARLAGEAVGRYASQAGRARASMPAAPSIPGGGSTPGQIAGDAMGLAATAMSLALPIKKAMEFEDKMADIRKVVDFPTPDGLRNMEKAIKSMAREIPISQAGLAEIVAQGGQLGIPAEHLESFAREAAKMSVAFDMLPAQAGESMAKLSNIFGIPIDQVTKANDAINHLGNTTAASSKQIVEGLMSGAGAGGRAMGLTAEQSAGLVAAFVAQGRSASEAGTRVEVLARNLLNSEKTGKLLGKEFDALMQKNPAKALDTLLVAINKGAIPQEKLNELLGETVNDFTLLAKNLPQYRDIMGKATDATAAAGSMQKEFESRISTSSGQMEMLKNRVSEAAINFGTLLLPSLNVVMGVVGGFASQLADLVEAHPVLAEGIAAVVAGLVLMRGAMLASQLAAWAFGGRVFWTAVITKTAAVGMKALRFALLLLNGAFKIAAAGVRILGLAILTTPIGWILAGIAAIAAAAYLIYRNWDDVAPWMSAQLENIKQTLGGFLDFFAGIFTGDMERATGGLKNIGEGLKAYYAGLWEAMKGIWGGFVDWIDDTFGTDIRGAIESVWQMIKPIIDKIMGAVNAAREAAQAVGLIEAPPLPQIPVEEAQKAAANLGGDVSPTFLRQLEAAGALSSGAASVDWSKATPVDPSWQPKPFGHGGASVSDLGRGEVVIRLEGDTRNVTAVRTVGGGRLGINVAGAGAM